MAGGKTRLRVGDVIDLRGGYLRSSKDGRQGFMAVVRDEFYGTSLCLISDKKYADLLVGRVTVINSVSCVSRMYNGKWKEFTNVYVEYENAFGETPRFIAANNVALTRGKGNTKSYKEWKRPEFLTGEYHGEEED